MIQLIGDFAFLTARWPLDPQKPVLIFIHGAATSKGLWQFQVNALADVANPIALDLPGHGGSRGPGYKRIADYAQSVIHFMDAVPLDKAVMCGLSMGGAVVLDLLIHHPQRCCAGILMHTGAKLKVMPLIFDTISRNYHQYFDLMIQFALAKETEPGNISELLRDIVADSPETAILDFTACDSFDVMDRLHEIDLPVLVIVGDQDNVTPPKYGRFLCEKIVRSCLVSINGTGHLSPLEKPETVNHVLRDFLTQMNLLDNPKRI